MQKSKQAVTKVVSLVKMAKSLPVVCSLLKFSMLLSSPLKCVYFSQKWALAFFSNHFQLKMKYTALFSGKENIKF